MFDLIVKRKRTGGQPKWISFYMLNCWVWVCVWCCTVIHFPSEMLDVYIARLFALLPIHSYLVTAKCQPNAITCFSVCHFEYFIFKMSLSMLLHANQHLGPLYFPATTNAQTIHNTPIAFTQNKKNASFWFFIIFFCSFSARYTIYAHRNLINCTCQNNDGMSYNDGFTELNSFKVFPGNIVCQRDIPYNCISWNGWRWNIYMSNTEISVIRSVSDVWVRREKERGARHWYLDSTLHNVHVRRIRHTYNIKMG